LRNKVRNKTRLVEKRHQNEIAKASKKNPKHFWRYVKTKTVGKEPVSELRCADKFGQVEVVFADNSKAEVLCYFFSSVFNDEKEQIFDHLQNKNCMYVSKCPRFEIEDIRDRLKN